MAVRSWWNIILGHQGFHFQAACWRLSCNRGMCLLVLWIYGHRWFQASWVAIPDRRFGPAERRDLWFLLFDSLTIADVHFHCTGPEKEKQMFLDNILFSKCSQRSPQGWTEGSGYLIWLCCLNEVPLGFLSSRHWSTTNSQQKIIGLTMPKCFDSDGSEGDFNSKQLL